MDSIIEQQRQTHEEVERLEKALAGLITQKGINHDRTLANEHRAKDVLGRINDRITTLSQAYADVDESRRNEISRLSAPENASAEEELSEFYARLKAVNDFHRKYPDAASDPFALELEGIMGEMELDEDEEDPIALLFSGEESYGRYLDLYANHTQYNNLKHISKRVPYLQYLDLLAEAKDGFVHRDIPKATRGLKEYENYLQALHSYLLSFTKRTQPLVDVDDQQLIAAAEFEKLWSEGQLSEWEEPKANDEGEGVWCSACQKMYAKQTVYDAHLKSKKHIKAAERSSSDPSTAGASSSAPTPSSTKHQSKLYPAARFTALIQPLLIPLLPVLVETKSNVERRFSLTARERELELQAAAAPAPSANNASGGAGGDGAANDEDEEEERIYNPLKLPMGWDGKPIPYWLYKLHGLGVEYRCEICTDAVYMGRKNFERHFQESRHAFGMRALGLPNTKHFHEITKIEDALALAEKLKREGRQQVVANQTTEELEDEDGNVYDKRTYEDLKKQGIIQ
ncbi:hypothetical protein DL93DRAFT_140393 [Clavulina sp. PMI_390]|nr:hypothetical protein DL93DRAFT_140393 [Clavulina sp. PMI_390]